LTRSAETMFLRDPSVGDILHVTANLRAGDRQEIEVQRGKMLPSDMLAYFEALRPYALVFHAVLPAPDRSAVALLGVWKTGLVCGEAGLLATDDFPLVAKPLTRHVRGELIPAIVRSGMGRVECRAHAAHRTARRWLQWLGAIEECELPDMGGDGASYFQYAWRKSDVRFF